MLSPIEKDTLSQAFRLIEITKLSGWKDIQQLLSNISQRHYPDPTKKKYKYSPWEHIEKDYTFARGATEAVKEFLEVIGQQEDIAKNLQDRDKKDGSYRIGE